MAKSVGSQPQLSHAEDDGSPESVKRITDEVSEILLADGTKRRSVIPVLDWHLVRRTNASVATCVLSVSLFSGGYYWTVFADQGGKFLSHVRTASVHAWEQRVLLIALQLGAIERANEAPRAGYQGCACRYVPLVLGR